MENKTPEQHHDDLMAEIEYELREYGPRSLAALIATILEDDGGAWTRYAPKFRAIEEGK